MSMQFEKFNVSKPRKGMQNGEEKTFWDNVGKITIFKKEDGSESGKLELYSFGHPTIELNVFPQKPKTQTGYSQTAPKDDYSQPEPKDDYSQPEPGDDIRVENIPF